jgi:hypothetical protein
MSRPRPRYQFLDSSSCPAPANRNFGADGSERPFSSPWIVLARDLRIICSGFGTFPGFVEVFQVLVPQFPLRLQMVAHLKDKMGVTIRSIRMRTD